MIDPGQMSAEHAERRHRIERLRRRLDRHERRERRAPLLSIQVAERALACIVCTHTHREADER